MNVPPKVFTRVQASDLTSFVTQIFEAVGVPPEDAQTLSELLVLTDLRGVFSHGTQKVPQYVKLMEDRQINRCPRVRVVHEGPTTAVIDGDGGLGHFPSLLAARMATEKALEFGLGAATTRNHNHIGSAGKYSRIPTESGCVGFATSSHVYHLDPEVHAVHHAGGGSPMSFAFPHGSQPPVVIDMASWFVPVTEETIEKFPAAIFKALGLGATCAGLGKILAGVADLHQGPEDFFPGANQGAFILAINVESFMPIETFLRDMDAYVQFCRSMRPVEGYDSAELPGNLEWEREQEWRRIGIPICPEAQAALEATARGYGIPSPFAKSLLQVS